MESVQNNFQILNNQDRLNNQQLEKQQMFQIIRLVSFKMNFIKDWLAIRKHFWVRKSQQITKWSQIIQSLNGKIKSFSNQVSVDIEQWEKTLQIDQDIELLYIFLISGNSFHNIKKVVNVIISNNYLYFFFKMSYESQFQCKVFCEVHQLEITHLYVGKQTINQRIFCQECLKKNQNIEKETTQINDAINQTATLIKPVEKYFSAMKSWFDNINMIKKNIISIHENQMLIINKLIEDIQKLINKEEQEFQKIFDNVSNLNLKQLNFFSQIFISVKLNQKAFSDRLNEELNQNIDKFFNQSDSLFCQYQIQAQNLKTRLQNVFQEVNDEQEYLISTQQVQNNEIQILCYSEKTEIVITVQDQYFILHPLISEQFQDKKTIETDHFPITALAFADSDNNHKLYLAGEEKYVSSWLWNNKLQTYIFEKKFKIDLLINKFISYNDYQKMIAFSKNQIFVCDFYQMKIDYYLTDFQQKQICAEVYCSDLSSSGLLLVCYVQNYLILWKKFKIWQIYIQWACEKQISLCFIHNSLFFSINDEGKIKQWEIKDNKIFLIASLDSQSSYLLYCKNIQTLICYSEKYYKLYQIKQNKILTLVMEKTGSYLKLCASREGEILVIFNAGTLIAQYIILRNYQEYQSIKVLKIQLTMFVSNLQFIQYINMDGQQIVELNVPQILCPRHMKPIHMIDINPALDGQNITRPLCQDCREIFQGCIDYEMAFKTRAKDLTKYNEIIQFSHSTFFSFQQKIFQSIKEKLEIILNKIEQNIKDLTSYEEENYQIITIQTINNYEDLVKFANKHQKIYHNREQVHSNIYYEKKMAKRLDNTFDKIIEKLNVILQQSQEDLQGVERLVDLSWDIVNSQKMRKQLEKSIIGKFKDENYNTRSKMYFDQKEEIFAISKDSLIQFYSKIEKKQFSLLKQQVSEFRNESSNLIKDFSLNQQFKWFAYSIKNNLYFSQVQLNKDQISISNHEENTLPNAVEQLEVDSVHNYYFLFFAKEFQVWTKQVDRWRIMQKVNLNCFFKAQFNQNFSLLMIQQERKAKFFDIYEICQIDQQKQNQNIIREKNLGVTLNEMSQPCDYFISFFTQMNEIQQNTKDTNIIFFKENKLYFQKINQQNRMTETVASQKLLTFGTLFYSDGSKILSLISFEMTILYLYKLENVKNNKNFVCFTHIQMPQRILNVKISPKDKFIALIDHEQFVTIYQIQLLPLFANFRNSALK